MYGFHKIPQLQQGVLKSDSDIEIWNFAHPHFRRGEPNLLNFIQRKRQAGQSAQADGGIMDGVAGSPGVIGTIDFHDPENSVSGANQTSGQVLDIQSIMNGISAIKRHQSSIQAELVEIKQSNQLLWQDAMDVRTKYQKQQDTINRIVKFLAGVFGSRPEPHKDDGVEAVNSRAVIPRRRTRLMIEDGRNKKAGVTEVQEEDEDEDLEVQFLGQDGKFLIRLAVWIQVDLHLVVQSIILPSKLQRLPPHQHPQTTSLC
jgi:heat shock transcription factor, other eukaryote